MQPPPPPTGPVAAALLRNAAGKAAGRELLYKIPCMQKMEARLRSAVVLCLIALAAWPTVCAVTAICVAHRACCWAAARLVRWQQQQDQKRRHARQHPSVQHCWQQQQQQPWSTPVLARLANGCTPAHSQPGTSSSGGGRVGTAIVTGGKMTKALHVCRHLHAAGWRVVLLETHKYWHVGARFSTSVDRFCTVPVPEEDADAYVRAIAGIAKHEGASLFIPVSSPIASLYDALAAEALPEGCRSWCASPAMTALLDDKVEFSSFAASLGLSMPAFHRITSKEQLAALNSDQALCGKVFILKSLSYSSVHRADLFRMPCPPTALQEYLGRPGVDISPQQPWILQEFIQGNEFSCYALAEAGRVVAFADTSAELSNLNYSYAAQQGIRSWVDQFVSRSRASGQLCIDFIQDDADGRLLAIECNPRTSSIITEFYDNPTLAQAFADPSSILRAVLPLPASRPTYWWFNEVARLLLRPGYLWEFLLVVSHGVDAVFDVADPLPFLALHFLQVPALLLGNMLRGNPWKNVDLCIGKIAELYGD